MWSGFMIGLVWSVRRLRGELRLCFFPATDIFIVRELMPVVGCVAFIMRRWISSLTG